MRIVTWTAAAALLVSASTASAQTSITLSPPDRDRWDVAVQAGRQGVDRSDIGDDWNGWYESGAVSASAGYYFTPHLKIEADVSRAGEATLYVQDQSVVVPGQSWPYPRIRDHRFRTTTASGAVLWQFLENQWFHPFAGAGVLVLHERQRADALPPQEIRGLPPFVLPALPELRVSRFAAQPFLTTGFKVYVGKQAFIRTDLRVGVGRGGAESAVWRAGIGIDF
jgi:hypothetical protein